MEHGTLDAEQTFKQLVEIIRKGEAATIDETLKTQLGEVLSHSPQIMERAALEFEGELVELMTEVYNLMPTSSQQALKDYCKDLYGRVVDRFGKTMQSSFYGRNVEFNQAECQRIQQGYQKTAQALTGVIGSLATPVAPELDQ